MKLEVIKPDISEKYIGKKFKYHSKYGGTVENILCEDVNVYETISHINGDVVVESLVVNLISDKGNTYKLEDVEFYD